jgi:hypothetical protein
MFDSKAKTLTAVFVLVCSAAAIPCGMGSGGTVPSKSPVEHASSPSWTQLTDHAAFPGAYNFPVFTVRNQMWAFHPAGNWYSTDGRSWTKSEMPLAGASSGYQKYVQFNDAVYLLGTVEGDYRNMRLGSRIIRTVDFKRWDVVANTTNLPARVFYRTVVFKGKIWLMGGFDGKNYYNDVWNSADGVRWRRVAETTAWSPRNIDVAVVFKSKIWIIGGGVIDGQPTNNPQSRGEIWSSYDGANWTKVSDKMVKQWGASPIVFDGKLWLVGANRDGNFTRAVLVTDDGMTWKEHTAPWTPRGAAATWMFGNGLYMTGGKYSVRENGEQRFIYSNDVWVMTTSQTSLPTD